MIELLAKKQRRQMRLLETLIREKRWFHLKELAEMLDCTERSLKEDLSNLRTVFNEFLIESSTNGIKISYDDSIGIEVVYHHFFKESTAFSLLEYLFFHKDVSSDLICRRYDLSQQSFYRLIRNINQIIQEKYNIRITLNPLNVVGDEVDIRFFYSQYFAERYYYLEWPFPDIREQVIIDFITFFYKLTEIPLTYSIFHSYKIMLTVYLYRIKQGYRIEGANNFEQYAYLYQELPKINEMLRYFGLQLGVEFNEETIEQLFIIFLQKRFYFTPQGLIDATEEDAVTKKSYILASQFLDHLSESYGLELENYEEMIMHIHNTAYLERREIFGEFLLYDTKSYTNEDYRTLFPKFYQDVETGLYHYLKEMGFHENPENLKHQIYTVFSHWENLLPQLLRRRTAVKVLIISRYDDHHAKSMIDFLKFYCTDNFEFSQVIKHDFKLHELEHTEYDVIVANFMIPDIKGKKFICTSSLTLLELVEKLNVLFYDFTRYGV
ncbi:MULTISPECIES: M protein trans-acting positive regulator PRD domain-containing protein [Streptococcus]|mgnify:FL=1|uniref:Capsule synthesis positive regulator AcpA n=2 Tax=Streptococcus TaxID=1301 RepID=A0A6N3CYJ2_STROR|nr:MULTISPECIES: M protein trans-acting positive regulator PRD domain-containing protein [Streptococcus]AMP67041.1 transcriptional regulator [Streptococcus sp. A12]RSK12161.1 Capsule synthesis positive regulator AcpA [Streptococcus australis]